MSKVKTTKFSHGRQRWKMTDDGSRVITHYSRNTENIESYVTNAASASSPYLVSTQKRYIELIKNRKKVTDRITNVVGNKSSAAIQSIADDIRPKEQENIDKFLEVMGMTSFEQLVSAIESKTLASTRMDKATDDALSIINRFFFAFRVGNVNTKEFTELLVSEMNDALKNDTIPLSTNKDYSNSKNNPGGKVNYNFSFTLGQIQEAYQQIYNALESDSIIIEDIAKMERTFTFLMEGLTLAKNKRGTAAWNNSINDTVYKEEMEKLLKVKNNVQAKFKAATNKDIVFKSSRNKYGVGFVNELLTELALFEALNNFQINLSSDLTADKIMDTAEKTIIITDTSLKQAQYKATDISGQVKNKSGKSAFVTADVKWTSKASRKKNNALSQYVTSFEINYGDQMQELFKEHSAEPLIRLYRSIMVNIAATQSYSLRPAERSMLLYNYFSNRDNFDHKFKVEKTVPNSTEYPMIVIANGHVTRFSDAIEKLAQMDLGSKKESSSAASFNPKKSIDHSRHFRVKNRKGKGNYPANFIDSISEVKADALDIENYYSSVGKKKTMLRFTLK